MRVSGIGDNLNKANSFDPVIDRHVARATAQSRSSSGWLANCSGGRAVWHQTAVSKSDDLLERVFPDLLRQAPGRIVAAVAVLL
jgi:hypothetical protein